MLTVTGQWSAPRPSGASYSHRTQATAQQALTLRPQQSSYPQPSGPAFGVGPSMGGYRPSRPAYDQTQMMAQRTRAIEHINQLTRAQSRGHRQEQCGTTSFLDGLWNSLQDGRLAQGAWQWAMREYRSNPFWRQKIAPEEGLKMALMAGTIVDARPGEAVDIYEAARRSNITEEYLEGSEEIALELKVDAAFRDVNPRLGKVASSTVPKPPGEYASPLWKTNQAGYVQNTETGQILVEVSSGKYDAFDASEVYDLQTGEIILDPSQGRVVGPDIDPYWWHGAEGRVAEPGKRADELQAVFGEAMSDRITHGQWVEYPEATGPNGPALVITRQGEFVWLQESEIPAWFDYAGVPYPFPR